MSSHIDDSSNHSQPSPSYTEIIGQVPAWMVRWGITLVFIIILLVIFMSWYIKYPDVIHSRIFLTTDIPPTSIISRSDGQLELIAKEKDSVAAGAIVAYIKNTAKRNDVQLLTGKLSLFRNLSLPDKMNPNSLEIFDRVLVLGEVQDAYNEFLFNLREVVTLNDKIPFETKVASLSASIEQRRKLELKYANQVETFEQQLALATTQLKRQKTLFDQKALSAVDYENAENLFLEFKRNYEVSNTLLISNQLEIGNIQSQITQLRIDRSVNLSKFNMILDNSLQSLQHSIDEWEKKYLLRSPVKGEINYIKFRSDNQFIRAGDEILVVLPLTGTVYGQLFMPLAGSGKVTANQRVYIKVDNYPYVEFGSVIGKISAISSVPRDGLYTVTVSLPKGLNTTYGKTLPFRQEMQGSSEIVTEDMRLIQRMVNIINSLFTNN